MSDSPHSLYRPLFRIDPGWPFVLAGLALLIAGVLIPAQRELHELRGQQKLVEANEVRLYARLESYDRFLNDLRAGDPDLVRRLAIAQLNIVPKGEQSLLLTPGLNQTVAQWIDESVPPVTLQPEPYPDTLLGRLALGPKRLWLLAAAAFLLFVGLLIGPDPVRPLGERARGGLGGGSGGDEGGEDAAAGVAGGVAEEADGASPRGSSASSTVARGAAAGAAVGVFPAVFGSAADEDGESEADERGPEGSTVATAGREAPTVATFASESRIAVETPDASVIDVEIVDDAMEVDEEIDAEVLEDGLGDELEDELEDGLEEEADDDLDAEINGEIDGDLDEDDASGEIVDEADETDDDGDDDDDRTPRA